MATAMLEPSRQVVCRRAWFRDRETPTCVGRAAAFGARIDTPSGITDAQLEELSIGVVLKDASGPPRARWRGGTKGGNGGRHARLELWQSLLLDQWIGGLC